MSKKPISVSYDLFEWMPHTCGQSRIQEKHPSKTREVLFGRRQRTSAENLRGGLDGRVEVGGNLVEVVGQRGAELLQGSDDRDSDQGSDEAVLDGGHTVLVTKEVDERHGNLQLAVG